MNRTKHIDFDDGSTVGLGMLGSETKGAGFGM
jgi:hypothetical protein